MRVKADRRPSMLVPRERERLEVKAMTALAAYLFVSHADPKATTIDCKHRGSYSTGVGNREKHMPCIQ